ncbi:hypothetical protein HMPREF0981_03833 [Erysipelotrichaceae bacterium 6_1_45]|uniref:hypothetical protein n=1 Tax=Clostridium innocuum TaxID=1522 RepID=UPI000246DC69|nr:hypothetical protein [[Clostridium] innocuum]EHO21985.1 hypothetical protein HMPREF0981_03833 [Erysipelotrichaceae bacterium 6_1_45]
MYNSRCNCSSNSGRGSSCARNGERILVNQSGCNTESRSRCSCVNTYRPGCGGNHGSFGCHHHDNDCGCGSNGNSHGCGCGNHRPCPPRPCPPRPCPPKPCPPRPCPPRPCPPRPCPPRPSCEDRCREQYRRCMRNCRLRDDDLREDYAEAFDYDETDRKYEEYEEYED